MRRMQGVDTTFFHAETPSMHLHVVGVLVLDPTSAGTDFGFETIVRLLRERIHLLPPLRWQPVTVPAGVDQPRWIEAPDFDVEHHVHRAALPPPADFQALADLVGAITSVPLDRGRPLWEMHVVDEMADGSVAVITKLHHSFMDGGAGSDVMASLFDLAPQGDAVPEPDESWRPETPPHPARLLLESVGGATARAAQIPGVLASTAQGMLRSARSMQARRGPAGDRFAPMTPLNGSLTPERAVAFIRCSLREVKHTKAAFGVTVNDVILAATTSALRATLADRDAVPDRPLIAMVPVSERDDSDQEFSNRTSALSVGLPVHLDDPLERLRAVRDLALDAKDRHQARGNGLLEAWTNLLPPFVVQTLARAYTESGVASLVPPIFNVIVSNVPGPPVPLYLAGARVTHIYPMGPLIEGAGLNLTLLSQGDDLDLGVMACLAILDDPERIGVHFAEGLRELEELAVALETVDSVVSIDAATAS